VDIQGWIGVVGGLAGSAALVYTASRSKAIEGYKAALRKQGFEHETRFARLHEKRVEVIAELYARLVRAEASVAAYVDPIEMSGGPTKDELAAKADEYHVEFIRFFSENRLWLDESLERQFEAFIEAIVKPGISFSVFRLHDRGSVEYFKRWNEAWQAVSTDVPVLRKAIETRFREMLGVAEAV
jgi:hypothetical protein